MSSANLYDLFRAHFPSDREATCLDVDRGPALSWRELDGRTARLAGHLGRLGVAAGDRVVVQVEKSLEAVLLYLACLRRGAIYVPLNSAYTRDEVAYFVADAEPRVLVCDPAAEASLAPDARRAGVAQLCTLDAAGGGSLAAWREAPPDDGVETRVDDDLAALLYTSGTTGRPKGAMLSHGNLAANARTLVAAWHWQSDDVLLHALPLFHAHGLFVALHCALLGGTRTVLLPKFDAARVAALLPRVSVYMGVPTHYTRLLELPELDAGACRDMRLFVSGSAPLPARTHRSFEERTGHRILERYGMTEALMITSNPYEGERVPGSVGYPLPGVSARVVDGAGKALAAGETGELEIRGPSVFAGYWRMPERTRTEFRDGWFRTGDLANVDSDGRVALVGRQKDLVISGGLNVYPAEVEAAVDAVAGVRESAVIGVPHPDFGEGVTAVVVRDPEGPDVTEASLRDALEGVLARFKHPKRVFFLDALPRNTMGKVQKSALRERFADAYSA